jgi:uncharacterized membrane protein YphA (DoxX/SURF4 family)
MLASMFIGGGAAALRNPEPLVPVAEPVAVPVARRSSLLPEDAKRLVRINGAVQVGAGVLLALGRLPRLSALALAVTLVPTTAAGHPFWTLDDPEERAHQRIHFLKNVSMMGGLLLAAADTQGKPSLAYRARAGAHHASAAASGTVQGVTDSVTGTVQGVADSVGDVLAGLTAGVAHAAGTVKQDLA